MIFFLLKSQFNMHISSKKRFTLLTCISP